MAGDAITVEGVRRDGSRVRLLDCVRSIAVHGACVQAEGRPMFRLMPNRVECTFGVDEPLFEQLKRFEGEHFARLRISATAARSVSVEATSELGGEPLSVDGVFLDLDGWVMRNAGNKPIARLTTGASAWSASGQLYRRCFLSASDAVGAD
jgi:hypothetical protein